MPVNVSVPSLGESITEAAIDKWMKNVGDPVAKDETLVTIESDKATVEVPSPVDGILLRIAKKGGERVKIGETIAELDESAAVARGAAATAAPVPTTPLSAGPPSAAAPPVAAPLSASPPAAEPVAGPAARHVAAEQKIDLRTVQGTGPAGRILKEDVLRRVESGASLGGIPSPAVPPAAPVPPPSAPAGAREEQVVPMTPLRKTIAERLVRSKQTTAMLTTFNEIDMTNVMELRARYQPKFQERYQIKLGLMSFFVKAAIEALKLFPQVNAEIRGDSIVFKNYFDIGVAVGGGKGLTVPVIRDADTYSFAQLEQKISDFGKRAQDNKLKLEELQGGTFTISNGGVYGSLLSTPILNPPQVGILGMHKIEKRPVAIEDQIAIRPMMYVALSYDHRIIDGRESVQFLIKIKECVENPERILLEV